jgi:hypothetical protein
VVQPTDLVELLAAARRLWPASTPASTAETTTMTGVAEALARITRRDPQAVLDAATQLGIAAQAQQGGDPYPVVVLGLAQETGIARVWELPALAVRLGVGPGTLADWATAEPDWELFYHVPNVGNLDLVPDRDVSYVFAGLNRFPNRLCADALDRRTPKPDVGSHTDRGALIGVRSVADGHLVLPLDASHEASTAPVRMS